MEQVQINVKCPASFEDVANVLAIEVLNRVQEKAIKEKKTTVDSNEILKEALNLAEKYVENKFYLLIVMLVSKIVERINEDFSSINKGIDPFLKIEAIKSLKKIEELEELIKGS